jgi:hypothetical protein
MPYGPVLSATLDRINEPEMYERGYWGRHISPKRNYEVALREPRAELPHGALSAAEEALLDEIFERFGAMDRWELVRFTHSLPEWTDPEGSSLPIQPDEILQSAGYSQEEIAGMMAEWEEAAYAASLFA